MDYEPLEKKRNVKNQSQKAQTPSVEKLFRIIRMNHERNAWIIRRISVTCNETQKNWKTLQCTEKIAKIWGWDRIRRKILCM